MTRVYYKEAVGAFIVFDVTRAQTFDCITKWKNDLDSKVTLPNGSPIPTVLLANKVNRNSSLLTPNLLEQSLKIVKTSTSGVLNSLSSPSKSVVCQGKLFVAQFPYYFWNVIVNLIAVRPAEGRSGEQPPTYGRLL